MKRILLVDDQEIARRAMKFFLEEMGYDTAEANNGAEALALLDQGENFDLVLSDNQMPVMTGMEFIQILSKRSYLSTHPVILYSGNLTEELSEQALKLGVFAVLSKPYNFQELRNTVARACEPQ